MPKVRPVRQETGETHRLYAEHRDLIRRVARRFARRYAGLLEPEDFEQIIAVHFVRLAQSHHAQRDGPFGGYLWKALNGIAMDFVAVEAREYAKAQRVALLDASEPFYHMPDVDTFSALRDAFKRLPPRTREVLRLRYAEDLEPSEIARVLGRSGPTIRRAHAAGIAALRRSLQRR